MGYNNMQSLSEKATEYLSIATEWTVQTSKEASNFVSEVMDADTRTDALQRAQEKVSNFVMNNSNTLIFVGCSALTAYFSPGLFFAGIAISVIARVALGPYLKTMSEKIDDKVDVIDQEKSLFKKPNSIETGIQVLAAVDAVALGTLYHSASFFVNAFPIVGGMVVGNELGRVAYNLLETYRNSQVEEAEAESIKGKELETEQV